MSFWVADSSGCPLSVCRAPPGPSFPVPVSVCLFSIPSLTLVKVPGPRLHTGVAIIHPEALVLNQAVLLFDLCPFYINTVTKHTKDQVRCQHYLFTALPKGFHFWYQRLMFRDKWYMIMLFVFVVMECIVQVMAYLTRKWLTSCPHMVYFWASGQEFVLVLLFFGGGHFTDIGIIGFQRG